MIAVIFYCIGCIAAYGRINASYKTSNYLMIFLLSYSSWLGYTLGAIFYILEANYTEDYFFDFIDQE